MLYKLLYPSIHNLALAISFYRRFIMNIPKLVPSDETRLEMNGPLKKPSFTQRREATQKAERFWLRVYFRLHLILSHVPK